MVKFHPCCGAYRSRCGTECHCSCRLIISREEKCLASGRLAIWLDAVRAARPPSPEKAGPSRARGGHPFPKSSLGRAQIWKDVVLFIAPRIRHTIYERRNACHDHLIPMEGHQGCMRCRDSVPGALGLHRTPTSEYAGPRAAACFTCSHYR
ncbi:hypothetical protein N5P37_005453 [Trichoderma harzianum]|nr:hypothetical protein N5P37_005453 [Trichoderma harzianum]